MFYFSFDPWSDASDGVRSRHPTDGGPANHLLLRPSCIRRLGWGYGEPEPADEALLAKYLLAEVGKGNKRATESGMGTRAPWRDDL
jgi:hypothetical protein